MNGAPNRIRSFAVSFLLIAAPALPALAGVNRWSTSGFSRFVNRLAIDPVDSEIVYAGTSSGVFRSANGGLTWSDASDGRLDGVVIYSLTIDPLTPSNVYAGTSAGVLKSTDRGATWSDRRMAAAIHNLIFGSVKSTIYAADFDDVSYYPGPSSVYRSADDGETWSRSPSEFSIRPGSLIVDPTRPSTLYAAADPGGIYKSEDAGSTWRVVRQGPWDDYTTALAIDPRDPATLYAASPRAVYKSVDAGSTWRAVNTDIAFIGVYALVVNPRDPSTLYAGARLGVFRSKDGGSSWEAFGAGLTFPTGVYALAIDRTGTRLHAVSRDVFDYQILSGALDVSSGSDGKAHLISADPEGRLTFRTIDGSGNSEATATYGPYSGWTSRAVADGLDGLTRVLWTNQDGSAALWLVGPEGNRASYRIGPAAGWTAVDVAASVPATTHLLWTNADGRIALSAVDNAGRVTTGVAHGPYPGWTAVAIADGQDGAARVLWKKTDGSAGLSLFGPDGLGASYRYGPVAGWTAADLAVGADGQTRILWTDGDDRVTVWRVDASGSATKGPEYAAPTGLAPIRITAGPDGLTRLLWTDYKGGTVVWVLSADSVLLESFGP